MSNDLYLMHHGIKGMHWGVRRFEDASGHLTPAGKRRYGIQDARKYYKINRLERARENTTDPRKISRLNKRIRKTQTRSDRKHADLTQEDINIGREIVAKNRKNMRISATAISAASTAAATAILYNNPNTRWAAPLAAAAGSAITAKSASKIPYYHMEAKRYGKINQRGATKRGMTDIQKRMKKAANVAGTAALIGGSAALAGYTAKEINKHKEYNQTYKNADPETRKAMDAERHYNQGVAVRNAVNKAFDTSRNVAKKTYDVATSPETVTKVKNAASSVRDAVKSDKTSSVINTTKKAATTVARTGVDVAKGFVGIKKPNESTPTSTKTQPVTSNNQKNKTPTTSTKEQKTPKSNKAKRSFSDIVSSGSNIYNGLKSVKNRDAAGAIAAVTSETINYTNRLLETNGIHLPGSK